MESLSSNLSVDSEVVIEAAPGSGTYIAGLVSDASDSVFTVSWESLATRHLIFIRLLQKTQVTSAMNSRAPTLKSPSVRFSIRATLSSTLGQAVNRRVAVFQASTSTTRGVCYLRSTG